MSVRQDAASVACAADDAGRHARDHGPVGHVFCYDCAGADNCALSDGHPAYNRRVRADGGAAPYAGRFQVPVRLRLQAAVGVTGPRVPAVREHHAMADEDVVLYEDAFTNETVGRDLARSPNSAVFLYLHKWTDSAIFTDRATIDVYLIRPMDEHALSKHDVFAYSHFCMLQEPAHGAHGSQARRERKVAIRGGSVGGRATTSYDGALGGGPRALPEPARRNS